MEYNLNIPQVLKNQHPYLKKLIRRRLDRVSNLIERIDNSFESDEREYLVCLLTKLRDQMKGESQ